MLGSEPSSTMLWILMLLFLVFNLSIAVDTGQFNPSGQRVRPASNSPPDQPAPKRPTNDYQAYQKALEWSNNFLANYPGAQAPRETLRDLERWGWEQVDGHDVPDEDMTYLRGPLLDLGVSADHIHSHHSRVCMSHAPPRGSLTVFLHSGPAGCLDQFMYQEEGVIAVMEVQEPEKNYAAAQNNNNEHQLGKWQDVVAVAWRAQCESHREAETGCGHLQWVLEPKIVEEDTVDIMLTALNGDWQKLKRWPGTVIDVSTDPGKALLGTVTGRRVAELISQHQDMFPGKTVTKVAIYDPLAAIDGGDIPGDWLSDRSPGLVFHIGAAAGLTSQVSHPSTVMTGSGQTSNVAGQNTHFAGNDWQQAVATGRQSVTALNGHIAAQPQSVYNSLDDVARYGWRLRRLNLPATKENALIEAYRFFGLGLAPPSSSARGATAANHMTSIAHSGIKRQNSLNSAETFVVDDIEYKATKAAIDQAASPKEGVLVIQNAPTMQQAAMALPPSKRPTNYPPVGAWQDLGLLLWKQACQANGVLPNALKYVFAIGIQDTDTTFLANHAYQQVLHDRSFRYSWPGTPGLSGGSMAFSTASEIGMALVGSTVGQQVASMLRTHYADFSRSRIDTVYLYYVSMDWTPNPRSNTAGGPPVYGPVETRPCLVFHIQRQ